MLLDHLPEVDVQTKISTMRIPPALIAAAREALAMPTATQSDVLRTALAQVAGVDVRDHTPKMTGRPPGRRGPRPTGPDAPPRGGRPPKEDRPGCDCTCRCGHRWQSQAAHGSSVRCPSCGRPNKVNRRRDPVTT